MGWLVIPLVVGPLLVSQSASLPDNRPIGSNALVSSEMLPRCPGPPRECRRLPFYAKDWVGTDVRVQRSGVTQAWPLGWPADRPPKSSHTLSPLPKTVSGAPSQNVFWAKLENMFFKNDLYLSAQLYFLKNTSFTV